MQMAARRVWEKRCDLTGSLKLAAGVFAGRYAHLLSQFFVTAIYHRWFRDRNLVWC